jgi:serine/threonine-protein kinase
VPVAERRRKQMSDDELSTRARLRVGTTLKGKYTLDAVLGVGGMAVVYAATHRNRNRVAVKILHPELSVDASLRARFVREGYVANTVEHRGTVRVLDDDVDDDGSVFLVMELLEGETLDARWARHGHILGAKDVATLTRDVLDVLAAAHAKGIVHRDLKPENLFLTNDGALKVLDFGIARLREASASTTRTGHVMGSPAFMPPEQALGRFREVDAVSDVWAVGATAFTLLSGRFVHQGETPEEMLVLGATLPAPPLASVVPGVPPELAAIVDRALAFQKRDRWQSAGAMREALARFLDADTQRSSPPTHHEDIENDKTQIAPPREQPASSPAPRVQVVPAIPMSTIAGVTARATTSRLRPRYAIGAAVGVAAALVVVGVVVARTTGSQPSVTIAPTLSAPSPTVAAPTAGAPSTTAAVPSAHQAVELVPLESLPRAASTMAPSAAPSPVSSARPAPPEPTKPVAPAPQPPAAASPSSPKARCDPPFTVDKTGVKRWKVECL